MSYRSILRTIGGVQVGLWRPQVWGDGLAALLLGHKPDEWYGTTLSGQPRALVAGNYWGVAVDTGWGNQTDMEAIDGALAWAETMWGRDITRLLVIAHDKGAVSALNWARLHPERVASLSLQSPVVDLETHYVRTPADRAAMESAYGGSAAAFLSAMPAWNPSRHQRRYMLRDFLRDRVHVWAAPDEPNDEAYLRLPGGTNNNMFVVDQNRLDIIGDIDIRWFGAADNWANGGEQTLVGKWTTAGNQRSWHFQLGATGQLQAQFSTDGTNVHTFSASVNPTVTNGQYRGLRFSWQQASGLLTFYESVDGMSWTQLGTTQNVLTGQSIFNSASQVEAGASSSGVSGIFTGTIKRIQVGGVTQTEDAVDYSIDFTTKTAGSRYIADDIGAFVWRLRGNSQLLGGPVTERFAAAIDAQHDVLADNDPTEVDPGPLITSAITADTNWTQQLALQQMARWTAYRMDNMLTTDWCGGDGTHSIILPDGRTLWTFSDTFTGTVKPDGSRSGAIMINNSLVVEEADGTFSSTLHSVGDSGASLLPPEPGHYYWLNDGTIEQEDGKDVIRLFAYNSQHTPDGWEILHIDLLTLDATTFAVLDLQQRSTEYATWNDFLERPDYTYIYGVTREWIVSRAVVARAPVGQVTGPWEFWNGSDWTADESQLAYMRDSENNAIEGSGPVLYHNGRYVLASKDGPLWGNYAELWHSTNPHGPWTKYYEYPIHEQGAERFGGITTCYGTLFHPQLPASPGHVIICYNVNAWDSGPAVGQGYSLNSLDSSIYQARFIEVPLPE